MPKIVESRPMTIRRATQPDLPSLDFHAPPVSACFRQKAA
jgi:hypothetical protein